MGRLRYSAGVAYQLPQFLAPDGRRPGSLSVSAGAPRCTATSARGMCLRVLDRRFDPGAPGILSAAPGANGHRIGRPESLFREGVARSRPRVPIARKPIRGVLL